MTLDDAYKIGERMAKPWQWATVVLATTVVGLLTYLLLTETTADVNITAEDLQAALLKSSTTIESR